MKVFNLDRTGLTSLYFFHFESKRISFCHKLLKYKPRYDLQGAMSRHNGFQNFANKVFPS